MIEEGVPDTQGPSIALYETGSEHFTRGTTFHYRDKQDKNSPVESYFIIGQTGKADADNIFASAFPVFKKGAGCPIVRKVDAFQVWSNALEATATINLKRTARSCLSLCRITAEFLIKFNRTHITISN